MALAHLDRRGFLTACSRAGVTSALLPGILYTLAAQAQEAAPETKPHELAKITAEMIDQAAALAGVGPFTADQKKLMLGELNGQREAYEPIRALKLANSVPPAFVFHPQPAAKEEKAASAGKSAESTSPDLNRSISGSGPTSIPSAPAQIEELVFAYSERAKRTYQESMSSFRCAYANVPWPPQALRSEAPLCHHTH